MDTDGYCRECRTKHGPWGHLRYLPEVDMVAIKAHDQAGGWTVMPREEYERGER